MQSCTAMVVSVCKSGFGLNNFNKNDLEEGEVGARQLYNRELGLISYNHKEEPMGSWHEVEHFWRSDDGFGNQIYASGACSGRIVKTLPQPLLETDGVVTNDRVHHVYSGTGLALDVECNYMTLWHDHLGLVVHFGEDLDKKFQPLQPLHVKTQPCAHHRLVGFHANQVKATSRIRLQNLYFAKDAKVETVNGFLLAKCYNNHRVVLLDKRRALATEEEFPVGESINLAYYHVHTAFGPMFIAAFVTQETYFDDHFDSLRKTRGITDYLHGGFTSSKSEAPRYSSSKLQKLSEEHLTCWNVDHCDVSWYTDRFIVDSPTLMRKNGGALEKEKEEDAKKAEVKEKEEEKKKKDSDYGSLKEEASAEATESSENEEKEGEIMEEQLDTKEDKPEEVVVKEEKEEEEIEKTPEEKIVDEVVNEKKDEDEKKEAKVEANQNEEKTEEEEAKDAEVGQKPEEALPEVEKKEEKETFAENEKEKEKVVENEKEEEKVVVNDSKDVEEVIVNDKKEKNGAVPEPVPLQEDPSLAVKTESEEKRDAVDDEEEILKNTEVVEDEDYRLELDLGDLTDDTLLRFDLCGEEEESMAVATGPPKAVEPVQNVKEKENNPKVKHENDEKENNPNGMTPLPNPLQTEKKVPASTGPQLRLSPQSKARIRVFKELTEEEMRNSFQEEVKRRAAESAKDLITEEKVMKRAREILDMQENRGDMRSPSSRTSSGGSGGPSPVGGAPLGMGGKIPAGMMKPRSKPPTPSIPPPSTSSSSSAQKPSSSRKRIGIVPRATASFSNSSSGSSGGNNRSFGSTSNITYLDMGPRQQGETVENYLDRVIGVLDSEESKTIRIILNNIMMNGRIQQSLKGYFPALHRILLEMYRAPNLVGLGALDLITAGKNESSGSAHIDRISMESLVFELLKTKSRPLWECIKNELPFVNGY